MTARRVAAVVLALVAGSVVLTSGARLERLDRSDAPDELLYLPNGVYLRALSAEHAGLLADLTYIWAIQYYSDYERVDRYRYLEHVFADVISELDPRYVDPYWLGSLIVIVEGGDLEAGLRLLDKGAERNPEAWVLPYVAAWECYRAGQFERAAAYFRRAAAIEDAPIVVRQMEAGMVSRAGDVEGSIALWREVRDDPASDVVSIAVAERQIRDLRVRDDVRRLTELVDRFRERYGRVPDSLDELVARGYLSKIPADPDGRSYRFDRDRRRVVAPAGRVLGGS